MFRVESLELSVFSDFWVFSVFSVFSDMLDFSVFGVLLGCSVLLDCSVLLVVVMVRFVPAFSPSFICGFWLIRSWIAMLYFFEME